MPRPTTIRLDETDFGTPDGIESPTTGAVVMLTLVRSVGRFFARGLGRRIGFPVDRLGYVLEAHDGERYRLYRETRLSGARGTDGAVVNFRLSVPDDAMAAGLRSVLFDPLSNVFTPLFAGLPGFRRKLWLAGSDDEFLELYEWDTRVDAERFVETFRVLLRPFEFLGSASFEISEENTIEAFVRARSMGWRRDGTGPPAKSRAVTAAVVAGAVLLATMLLRKVVRRAGSAGQQRLW